jgi:hypothetical protein
LGLHDLVEFLFDLGDALVLDLFFERPPVFEHGTNSIIPFSHIIEWKDINACRSFQLHEEQLASEEEDELDRSYNPQNWHQLGIAAL